MNEHVKVGRHVEIGDAQVRLAELIAAALGGEDVVLAEAGVPQVRIVPVPRMTDEEARIVAKRQAAYGMYKQIAGEPDDGSEPSMSDRDLEDRWNRKFGPAA